MDRHRNTDSSSSSVIQTGSFMKYTELCLLGSSILLGISIFHYVLVEHYGTPDLLESGLRCMLHHIRILTLTRISAPWSISDPIIYSFNISDKVFDCENSECNIRLLNSEIHKQFEKDGVVALRNLIPADVLLNLTKASTALVDEFGDSFRKKGRGTQFHTSKMNAVFLDGQLGDAFRNVALFGLIPRIGSELLGISSTTNNFNNMRLLRDVFLAKDNGEYVCGWHVDDFGFWPAHPSNVGINAWIAIDDMPVELGGNFAVSPGSHNAVWRNDAYRAIGATPTFPEEGYESVSDMFANRVGSGTCNLRDSEPLIHDYLERNARIYNVKAGDVLFMTRWLWHQTIPVKNTANKISTDKVFKRYSIRYAPGSATTPKGYGTELSILWDKENEGKALNDVAGGPWYPRVFPEVEPNEINKLPGFVKKIIPEAEMILKERRKEMKPYLTAISRERARIKHLDL